MQKISCSSCFCKKEKPYYCIIDLNRNISAAYSQIQTEEATAHAMLSVNQP